MAKFVLELANGMLETPIYGEAGEELTTEQVMAYAQMQAGSSLARIADALETIGARLEEVVAELGDR